MKKIFLVVFFCIFLYTSTTIARPPEEVTAEFDLESRILSVKVTHNVGRESDSHYIEEVTITHNGKKNIVQKTSRQLSDTQTFLYFMPAVKKGDEIEVLAVCSLFGEGTFKFTVEDN